MASSSKKRAKVSSFVKFRQVKQARYAKNGKQNALRSSERSGKQLLYFRSSGATIEGFDITTAECKESSRDKDPLKHSRAVNALQIWRNDVITQSKPLFKPGTVDFYQFVIHKLQQPRVRSSNQASE